MRLHDYKHQYRGYWDCDSICRIQIFEGTNEQYGMTIVIATEIEDNQGTSITNCAAQLAQEISTKHGIRPEVLMWIEYYPKEADSEVEFSRVNFRSSDGRFGGASWTHLERSTVERWIGELIS